jgi:hypothetical protein
MKSKQTYYVECDDGNTYEYKAISFMKAYELAISHGHKPIGYTKIAYVLNDITDLDYDEAEVIISDFERNCACTELEYSTPDNYWRDYCSNYHIFDKYVDDEEDNFNIIQNTAIDKVIQQAYKVARLRKNKVIVNAISKLQGKTFDWSDLYNIDKRYDHIMAIKAQIELLYQARKCYWFDGDKEINVSDEEINEQWQDIINDILHDYLTMNDGNDGDTYIWYYVTENDDNTVMGITNIAINTVTNEIIDDDQDIDDLFIMPYRDYIVRKRYEV